MSWTLTDNELEVSTLVPPNTTAEVALPGQDALAVTSGQHKWHIRMPSEENAKPPITLDSTIGELMDDPALIQLFKDTLVKYFPEAAAYMDGADGSTSGVTIRSVGAMVPQRRGVPRRARPGARYDAVDLSPQAMRSRFSCRARTRWQGQGRMRS